MFSVLFYLFFGGVNFAEAVKATQKTSPEIEIQKTDASNEIKQQSHETEKQNSEKKWKLNFSHALRSRATVGSRDTFNNSISGLYRHSQILSFSVSISHILPLGYVSDNRKYSWTDTIISAIFPLTLPTFFLAQKWNGSAGISLPTSYTSRISTSKWFSLFGNINHTIKQKKKHVWTGGHTFYAGFYKYRTNRNAYRHNSLFSSSHSLSFTHKYKRLSFNATGRLYFSVSMRQKSIESFLKRIRSRGGQGLGFTLSYNHPKPEVSFFGSLSSNIPFISPVMTGDFPLIKIRFWSHLIGLRWRI